MKNNNKTASYYGHNAWLREYFSDNYVKLARVNGYRSRAVYKLIEIQDKYHFITPKTTILDLGASPGSWSQFVTQVMGQKSIVFAVDMVPMQPLRGVKFYLGDIRDETFLERLRQIIAEKTINTVISDMAPNTSGIKELDGQRSIILANLVLDFISNLLVTHGTLLIKVFQCKDCNKFIEKLKSRFSEIILIKPKASRTRSKEFYILAKNYTK